MDEKNYILKSEYGYLKSVTIDGFAIYSENINEAKKVNEHEANVLAVSKKLEKIKIQTNEK